MAKILPNSHKQTTLISISLKLEFIKKCLLPSPVVMVLARLKLSILENGRIDKIILLRKRKRNFRKHSLKIKKYKVYIRGVI